ncbi:hypothetical protein [Petrotoga sp. DB-2]
MFLEIYKNTLDHNSMFLKLNHSLRDLMKIIESKNFGLNIDDGVVKNSAIF